MYPYILEGLSSHSCRWVEPLVWTGFRRSLNQSDVSVTPDEADATKLLGVFNRYEHVRVCVDKSATCLL